MTATLSLAALLANLIEESGLSKKDFGSQVGLRGSTISHLLSGDPHYSLGVEVCLRIAKEFGASPSTLLRAAGKGAVAELIEELYGLTAERRVKLATQRGRHLSPRDEQHLERAAQLLLLLTTRTKRGDEHEDRIPFRRRPERDLRS